MNEKVLFTVDRDTYLKLRELGYLVVLAIEFNTYTQEYEVIARAATSTDI